MKQLICTLVVLILAADVASAQSALSVVTRKSYQPLARLEQSAPEESNVLASALVGAGAGLVVGVVIANNTDRDEYVAEGVTKRTAIVLTAPVVGWVLGAMIESMREDAPKEPWVTGDGPHRR